MKVEYKKFLIGIIFLSLFLRIMSSLYLGDQITELPGTADQISYHTLALRVLNGHGFTFGEGWWPATAAGAPTAHWSFLYTYYLVITYAIFGPHPLAARIIQSIIVGILQPILVFLLASRLFNHKVALVSAGLTTIYTYFIYYNGTLMTEPFYIISILASLYLATFIVDYHTKSKPDKSKAGIYIIALTLGIGLGIAILLRQLFLFYLPILFLWIYLSLRRYAITPLLISGIAIIAMILPFTIYNYSRFDRFVLLNTNTGFAFFWANHPIYGTHFVPILASNIYSELIPPELRNLDEAALDQALLKRGMQYIIDDPLRYILLSISRIPAFFKFWPSSDSSLISNVSRVLGFGLLLPFMIYGMVQSLIQRPKPFKQFITSPLMLVFSFIIFYTGIHLLSWALIRYRLPVDAVLIIFAGLGIVDIVTRIISRHRTVKTPA